MIFAKKYKTKVGGNKIKARSGWSATRNKNKTSTSHKVFSVLIKHQIKCGMFECFIDLYESIGLPLIRRAFPQLMAMNTVGVQPITGPIGIAYAMRYIYDALTVDSFNELI